LNLRPSGYEDFVNCEKENFSHFDDFFNENDEIFETDDIELF